MNDNASKHQETAKWFTYILLGILLAQILPFLIETLFKKYFRPNQFRQPGCLSVRGRLSKLGYFANYYGPVVAFVLMISSFHLFAVFENEFVNPFLTSGHWLLTLLYFCCNIIGCVPATVCAEYSEGDPY